MSGYFAKLIDTYGPKADTDPAHLPWMAEVAVPDERPDDGQALPAVTPAAVPDIAAVPSPDLSSVPPPPVVPAEAAAQPVVTSPLPEAAPSTSAPTPDLITPRALAVDTAPAAPQMPADPAPIIHRHNQSESHLHVTQTHLHQHDHLMQVITAAAFTPDAPPDPDSPEEIAPDPAPHDLSGALAALEAHLARTLAGLHSPAPPPPSIIAPADFEPEGARLPPPTAPETIREVTREIVREIHHHHETPPPAPPRPAPQTAAAASRIGPIRFASVWDRGGRAS